MTTLTIMVLAVLAHAAPSAGGEPQVWPWPAGVTYRAAGPDHVAEGPGAARPRGDGAWLFDARAHALVAIGADGSPAARVPVVGFVHALLVRANGDLAWVDLARRVVVQARTDGTVTRQAKLPAGVAAVRRLVEVDGRLWLHTAFQETLPVPETPQAPLGAWFQGRREGLLFASDRPAAQVLAKAGRVDLLLGRAPQGPTAGKDELIRVALRLPEPALAAEVLGPAPQDGWWVRLTFGARDAARDVLAAVGPDGAVTWQTPLPARGTLSWPDTLFVTPAGAVIGLAPTDAGVVRREWRRP